jgi:hypothetical protein
MDSASIGQPYLSNTNMHQVFETPYDFKIGQDSGLGGKAAYVHLFRMLGDDSLNSTTRPVNFISIAKRSHYV